MKFTQIPVGAQFRYQGEIYCKSSPLAASGPGGRQRLIPRSASVEPLQQHAVSSKPASPIQQALADYHEQCQALLRAATAAVPEDAAALLQRLDQAFAELTAKLE